MVTASHDVTGSSSASIDLCMKEFFFSGLTADFVVAEASRCHFGDRKETNGSVASLSGSWWPIYYKKGKYSDLFTPKRP